MSGPGKISEFFRNDSQIVALLYNFDVDVAELKPEHTQWLSTTVAPNYLSHDMAMTLYGLASPTGPNDLNMRLSERRAANVARKIWLLDPQGPRMPTEVQVALGEEAARLAGLADGVEDERWRGVLLAIYDPKKVPLPPKPAPPPNKVVRPIRKVFILTEKTTGIPKSRQDGQADRVAEGSRVLLQTISNTTPLYTTEELIDESWTVAEVSIRKHYQSTDVVGPVKHKMEYLHVDYVWGPFKGERFFRKDGGSPRPMDRDEMEKWLNHPLKTYRRKY